MEQIDWVRLAAFLFCVLVGVAALLLLLRYVLPILLPFLIAYLLSRIVRAPARSLSRHLHLPAAPLSIFLLLLLLSLGVAGIWLSVFYLGREALSLAERLLSDASLATLLDSLQKQLSSFLSHFGVLTDTDATLSSLLYNALSAIASRLPMILSSLLSALPNLLFFTLLVFVASVYFCVDGGQTERALRNVCPAALRTRLSGLRKTCGQLFRRYLRAYLVLFAMTFTILLCGFLLLGIDHALLLSLLISLADLLPVIGIGTLLMPWGLFLILTGESGLGLSLLVLYLVASILRNLAEPKILGKSLGLHPLLTLLTSWAGLTLFGFWGLLLSPVVALLVKALLPSRENA